MTKEEEKVVILPNKKWHNDVELLLYPDGEIAFSTDGAEHFIYLYKNQVKKLKKVLSIEKRKEVINK